MLLLLFVCCLVDLCFVPYSPLLCLIAWFVGSARCSSEGNNA